MVVVTAYGAWQGLDERGNIPHSRESIITAEPTWLVGESKTCTSVPELALAYDVTVFLRCDQGVRHQIRIRFWGRTERTDPLMNTVDWKCVKHTDSFVCYALD